MATREERLRKLQELRNPMMSVVKSIQLLRGEPGPAGPPGKAPVKGEDYFTLDEIQAIADYVQSRVKPGPKGEPGETPVRLIDYWTKEDREKIIADVLKKVKPGKDGVSPKMEDIVKAVMTEIEPMNSKFVIKSELVDFLRRGGFRGGGDTIVAGTNVTVDVNENGQKVINASGGGGRLQATGTIDDTNVTFTFLSVHEEVIINGASYRQGDTSGGVVVWTIVGTTVTLAFPVGTGGAIYGRE